MENILAYTALQSTPDLSVWQGTVEDIAKRDQFKWLRRLSFPWIIERAEKEEEQLNRLKQEADAAALEDATYVDIKSHKYAKLSKTMVGTTWAIGRPGVKLSSVNVDGHEYAAAPTLAPDALVPASYTLLPDDHAERPHQTVLPIGFQGEDDAPSLPVSLADSTQYAITPTAGKLGILIMAAACANGGNLYRTSLRELTKTINPDAPQLLKTHFETVCKGLVQLRGLRLVLPDGVDYLVFDCPNTWRELTPEEYDIERFVGLTKSFELTLSRIGTTVGKSYRGEFLFDLTGTMKLPTPRAGLLRQYIRAAAFWNAYWIPGSNGEPAPTLIPEIETERWAALTNYLPPAAVEYLRAKGKKNIGNRHKLSEAMRNIVQDAEELQEAGLLIIDKATSKTIRLLPTPEYIEAWHLSRTGVHKMLGKKNKKRVVQP